MNIKTITVYNREKFREWLAKNHDKEKKLSVVLYKKHTGKSSPSHREMIEEAICFGWIDTTVKRLDEDRYMRNFSKRTKNSTWSNNTIRYAKGLVKQKKMAPLGMKFFKEGLKKPTNDFGIPKNPSMPVELRMALDKNGKAKKNFANFPASTKKLIYRWILRGKLKETRAKRINIIVEKAALGRNDIFTTQTRANV